jgi:hypothetical protein
MCDAEKMVVDEGILKEEIGMEFYQTCVGTNTVRYKSGWIT